MCLVCTQCKFTILALHACSYPSIATFTCFLSWILLNKEKSININNITVYQLDFLGKHAYKNKYIGENNRKTYAHCIQIVQFQRNANGCTARRNEDKNRKKKLPQN